MLLVSIDEQGVWEYNKTTSAFGNQYMPENENSFSLLSNRIAYISKDRDNGFWLSSQGFGLSYAYAGKRKFSLCNPVSIRNAENSKFSPNGFISDPSGRVFCSTEKGGLFILDNACQIYKKIEGKDSETDARFKAINRIFKDHKQHIWLSSFFGLSYISEQYEDVHHLTDVSRVMLDGMELRDGRLIFSARYGGIFEARPEHDTYSLHQIKPHSFFKEYTPIQQDEEGRIWMNENLEKFVILDTSFNKITEIPISGICSPILEAKDGQTIRVASTTGLYNVNSRDLTIRERYNDGNRLPSSGLNSMLMDRNGKLWLTSNIGLIVFDPHTDSSRLYNYEDGLPSSNFNSNGAYQFDDGEMWFASARGITAFHPDHLSDIRIEAIPQITALLVNGKLPAKK